MTATRATSTRSRPRIRCGSGSCSWLPRAATTSSNSATVTSGAATLSFDAGTLTLARGAAPGVELHAVRRHAARAVPPSVAYTPGTVFTQGAMFEIIATAQPAAVGTLPLRASLAALEAAPDG